LSKARVSGLCYRKTFVVFCHSYHSFNKVESLLKSEATEGMKRGPSHMDGQKQVIPKMIEDC